MLNCFDPDTGEFDFIKGLMKANMINPEIDDIKPMVEVKVKPRQIVTSSDD